MIANGAACSYKLLQEKATEADFVLALDGALNRLLKANIIPDAVLGDLDSVEGLDKIQKKYPDLVVLHRPDQEKTDFEKGLDYLIEKGYKIVDILWATGARSDHAYANLSNLVKYTGRIQAHLVDDFMEIFDLPKDFSKNFLAGTVLSLMPIAKVEGILTENLRYPLHNEILEMGGRIGTSNEVLREGLVKIHFKKGHLLLAISF